jgi:hypothetical protein
MVKWELYERLLTSFLAVLQPFIIYILYGDNFTISTSWITPLQPLFIITNALVSFFFYKLDKWKIPAILLLLLTAFSVENHFMLHNILSVMFFIFSGISLLSLKKFRYYFLIFLMSLFFLYFGLFWVETWAILTLGVYHTHLMLYTYFLKK